MPGVDARRRVSVQRCKPCANPHDHGGMSRYLLTSLTQSVLSNFSKKSPPNHVTQGDVSLPLQRLEVENIIGHQSVRGRSGVIAVISRDALDGSLWAVLGAGNGPPAFRHEILRTGRALQTSTTKPTACTAGCELVLHNGNFLGTTASDFWCMDTAAFLA